MSSYFVIQAMFSCVFMFGKTRAQEVQMIGHPLHSGFNEVYLMNKPDQS